MWITWKRAWRLRDNYKKRHLNVAFVMRQHVTKMDLLIVLRRDWSRKATRRPEEQIVKMYFHQWPNTSLRTLLALPNEHDLEVHQMDFKTAFLNELNE